MTMRSIAALVVMAACIAGFLYVNERDYREAVAKDQRNSIASNCMPKKPNERCVIEKRLDGSVQVTKHENVGYGRAPRLVFAEVINKN